MDELPTPGGGILEFLYSLLGGVGRVSRQGRGEGYLAGVRGCIYMYGISVSSVVTLQALYHYISPCITPEDGIFNTRNRGLY